jgi:hypothetical protein
MDRPNLPVAPRLVAAFLALAAVVAHAAQVSVRKVEAIEGPETVVKIHLSAPLPAAPRAQLLPKDGDQPDRLSIDLPGADTHGKPSSSAAVGWGGVQRIRLGTPSADTARVVLDLDRPMTFDVASKGDVVEVTLHGPVDVILQEKSADETPPATAPPAPKPADGH